MRQPITPITSFQKLNELNKITSKNAPMTTFSLDNYLNPTALEAINSEATNSDVGTNAELINLLGMTTYNQIALNAIVLGNDPGLLNTTNDSINTSTINNLSQLMQKAYGAGKETGTVKDVGLLDQAKIIAQRISTLYEGGQVTGDFDGQGLSVGYLQWNVGSGTLQPLLKEMASKHPHEFEQIFGGQVTYQDKAGSEVTQKMSEVLKGVLKESKAGQLQWAKSINEGNAVIEPWKSALNELTKSDQFIDIENQHSKAYQAKATQIMNDIGVKTTRGFALAFDIAVQNGSVKSSANALVVGALNGQSNRLTNPQNPNLSANQRAVISDLTNRLKGVTDVSVRKLYYTAAAVAISSKDQFANDVWSRKVAIIAGEGKVHGSTLALDKNMGLNDEALG